MVLLAALMLGALWSVCAFLRLSRPQDLVAFLGMASECHSVWKQFAFRRFGAGGSALELFRRFPPTRREEFGRYGIYRFSDGPANCIPFTSLSVVTKDGKLIAAASGSCTWRFTFFSTQDPELNRQYAGFLQQRHRESERKRLERLEAELLRFFGQHDRWPTNEAEFGWFVTGEKPPTEASIAAKNKFMARYGLGRQKLAFGPTNPLGITFTFPEDGTLTMTLNGETGLISTVTRPSK